MSRGFKFVIVYSNAHLKQFLKEEILPNMLRIEGSKVVFYSLPFFWSEALDESSILSDFNPVVEDPCVYVR